MSNGINKQPISGKCVLCGKEVTSKQQGWLFTRFSICNRCIERIFQDII